MLKITAVLFLLLTALPSKAVQSGLTYGGFTGLGITPNADLLSWGTLGVAYEDQLPGIIRDPSGHTYVAGFGLLPGVEIAGRLATNMHRGNCFVAPYCGARDLAAAAKFGLAFGEQWRAAVGVTDFGGSLTFARAYYGVLTKDVGWSQINAGYAKRSGSGVAGSKSPLDGPFLSAAAQVAPAARVHVEYVDKNAWIGARLYAPSGWLPSGWQFSAGFNHRLSDSRITERNWFSLGLTIPLYRVGRVSPTSELPGSNQLMPSHTRLPVEGDAPASGQTLQIPHEAATGAPSASYAASTGPEDYLEVHRQLAIGLGAAGLQDIAVGKASDGAVAVSVSSGAFRINSTDAVGAALGVIARTLSKRKSAYRLVVTQRGLPLVGVIGRADCLLEWLQVDRDVCPAGELTTPGFGAGDGMLAGVNWTIESFSSSSDRVRIQVAPVLRSAIGTEVGAFDYSLGVAVGAQLPLWTGAAIDAAVTAPLANSTNFDAQMPFASSRVSSRLDRISVSQVFRLPVERWVTGLQGLKAPGLHAVTAQVAAGRFGGIYDGGFAAMRWEPGDGRHRFLVEGGAFRNNQYGRADNPWPRLQMGKPLTGSYRYSFLPTRTDLEATAGQFLANDRGIQLAVRQWFDDTNVAIFYKRTSYPSDVRPVQLLGIEMTFPIGPRRDFLVGDRVQLGGTSRFAHGLETTIRTGVNSNPISPGHGMPLPAAGLNDILNYDRTGLAWWQDNLRHVRSAAQPFLAR